jgi:5-methylthioadenosine/S-adenosylhomocysteine deaminase
VNAHTHLGMTNLRGFADDLILIEWLTKHIWPAEGKFVSPEFTRDGSELGLAESIRSGTTTVNDMYFFPETFCEVVDRVGVRAAVGMTCFEFPSAYASNAEEYISKGLMIMNKFADHPRIKFTTAPHAPYTVKDETFQKVLKISSEYSCPVHVHLHETSHEIVDTLESRETMQRSLSEHKLRPFANLQRMGLVNDKLVAVHMTALNDEEIHALAKAGSHVVHW